MTERIEITSVIELAQLIKERAGATESARFLVALAGAPGSGKQQSRFNLFKILICIVFLMFKIDD